MLLQELIYNLPIPALGSEEERLFTAMEFHYGNSTKFLLISNILWVCLLRVAHFSGTAFQLLTAATLVPRDCSKVSQHCSNWLFRAVLCIGLWSLWWQGRKTNAHQKMLTASINTEKDLLKCHLFFKGGGHQKLQLNSYVLELLLFYNSFNLSTAHSLGFSLGTFSLIS